MAAEYPYPEIPRRVPDEYAAAVVSRLLGGLKLGGMPYTFVPLSGPGVVDEYDKVESELAPNTAHLFFPHDTQAAGRLEGLDYTGDVVRGVGSLGLLWATGRLELSRQVLGDIPEEVSHIRFEYERDITAAGEDPEGSILEMCRDLQLPLGVITWLDVVGIVSAKRTACMALLHYPVMARPRMVFRRMRAAAVAALPAMPQQHPDK